MSQEEITEVTDLVVKQEVDGVALLNELDDEEGDDFWYVPHNAGRFSANLSQGRFLDAEKNSIGETLDVLVIDAPKGHTAWCPKEPDKPFFRELNELEITKDAPFCRNRNIARQAPRLHDDVSEQQVEGLKRLGWTGNCKSCAFAKEDANGRRACRPEIDMLVKRPEHGPERVTIKSYSIGQWYDFINSVLRPIAVKRKIRSARSFLYPAHLSFVPAGEDGQDFFKVVFSKSGDEPTPDWQYDDCLRLRKEHREIEVPDLDHEMEEQTAPASSASPPAQNSGPVQENLPGTEDAQDPPKKAGYF